MPGVWVRLGSGFDARTCRGRSDFLWKRRFLFEPISQRALRFSLALIQPCHLSGFRRSRDERKSDFTAIIPLANLTPETTYYLNVLVNGRSAVSRPALSYFHCFSPSQDRPETSSSSCSPILARPPASRRPFKHSPAPPHSSRLLSSSVATSDHRNPATLADRRTMFHDLYDPNTPFMSNFVPLFCAKFPIVHQWDDHDSG